MKIVNIILSAILFSPILGVLLYMAIKPENAVLWGNRWRFKNEGLEPNDTAIKYTRIMSIVMIIIGILIFIVAMNRS